MTRFICYNKHKIRGMAICVLAAVGGVGTAHAATCKAGYYDDGTGVCVVCGNGHYCPGDNMRIKCPANDVDWATIYPEAVSVGVAGAGTYTGRGVSDATKVKECYVNVFVQMPLNDGNTYRILKSHYYTTIRDGVEWNSYYRGTTDVYSVYTGVSKGYYLADCFHGNPASIATRTICEYSELKPCTNAPANAHYTGAGTPDVGNCPWECDDGFGHTSDDRCLPLCRIGDTAMNGINIYAEKHTKYAMAVPRNGATCWISAKPGQGGKLVPTN
ncbi:MAG: hypothetical protein IJ560_03820 [Alphaproteobacteria bacterium]|nr:hypothetical protein [Alphaproteobacteria bacterium]